MLGLFILFACGDAENADQKQEPSVEDTNVISEPSEAMEPSKEEPSQEPSQEVSSPATEPSSPTSEPSSSDACQDQSCGACPSECTSDENCNDGVLECTCECPEPIASNICETDADCSGGNCIDVVDSNSDIKVCQQSPPTTMHTCDYSVGEFEMMNDCCDNVDCVDSFGNTGYCLAYSVNYCGGPPPPESNICRYDECQQDSDCTTGMVCLDKGVLGEPINRCVIAECTSHADCSGLSGGTCSAVYDSPTCGGLMLTCTDNTSECRHYNDCSAGMNLCVKSTNGVMCEQDMPPALPPF